MTMTSHIAAGAHAHETVTRWVEPDSAACANAEVRIITAATDLLNTARALTIELGIPLGVAIQAIADAAKKAAAS